MHEDTSFKFDEWKVLAESDPESFEERRRQAIQQMIASVPAEMQPRLRGLQWRIDMERRKCSNPTMAFLHIYKMMWESLYGKRGLANAWQRVPKAAREGAGEDSAARILSFGRRTETT